MSRVRSAVRWLLPAAVLALPAPAPAQGLAPRPAPIDITLASEVRADGPIIRLGHIAQLTGGEPTVRAALANLDLAEFRTTGGALVLRRADVKFRLLVAGHDARLFRLRGAAHCRVQRNTGALTEAAVVHAAQQLILDQIAPVAQPLNVKPAGPVLLPALELGPNAKLLLHPRLTPARVTIGPTPVDVNIVIDGQLRAAVRAWFDVQPATQPTAALGFASASDGAASPVANPIVVRSRDRVRMTAQVGDSQVIAAGEALEDGRVGQSIRMRNIDSNKTVLGRVLGPGLVEVEY